MHSCLQDKAWNSLLCAVDLTVDLPSPAYSGWVSAPQRAVKVAVEEFRLRAAFYLHNCPTVIFSHMCDFPDVIFPCDFVESE